MIIVWYISSLIKHGFHFTSFSLCLSQLKITIIREMKKCLKKILDLKKINAKLSTSFAPDAWPGP